VKEKVVIVTGASSGIGLATADHFARRGSSVVMAARNEEKIKAIERDLQDQGLDVFAVVTDVSRESDCQRLVEKVLERYGKIDILINNAGISMRAIFGDMDLEVFRLVMQTNFWGTVYCTKYALPHILKQHGTVAGISSLAGFQALPGRTAYSASKFAMHGFLETLRLEYRSFGLHVFLLAPGFTSTNIRFTALTAHGAPQGSSPRKEKSMQTPDHVAQKIYSGIKSRRRMMVLSSIGKFTFVMRKFSPRLMDRLTLYFMSKEPGSPFEG
jgi:short-subunit dehydrogenase